MRKSWQVPPPQALHAPPEPAFQELSRGRLPDVYVEALAQTRWPGRAQVVNDAHGEACGVEPAANLVFHLDGAHTGESSAACAEWFAEVTPLDSVRVLMFNCMKVHTVSPPPVPAISLPTLQEREPHRLLSPIHSVLKARGGCALHSGEPG